MSPDPTAQIAAFGLEPTYSAREAAALLGRSFSWLDQRVRGGQFMLPDGTTVQPLRTPGGYRRFRSRAAAPHRPRRRCSSNEQHRRTAPSPACTPPIG